MIPKKPFKKGFGSSVAPYYKTSGTPFSITFISSANNTTGSTSFTFTAQNIGTADATRIVVVGIAHATNGAAVSTVTIGGVTATQAPSAAVATNGAGTGVDIWYLAVAAGTTADIIVSFGVSVEGRCAIDVYRVAGTGAAFSAANNNSTASSVTTLGAAATVPAGGGAIAILSAHGSVNAATVTGTNLTIDQNGVAFGNSIIAGGSNTSASGSTTFTFTWGTADNLAMAVATFTP